MNAVCLLSGGLDSTVLCTLLQHQGHTVRALSVDYGQRHGARELEAAKDVALALAIEHEVVDLSPVARLMAGSVLTDREAEVPHGHYADESMRATVVPNRNMLLLALAGAWAVSTKSDVVAYAAHAGDHAVYPDCRESFASTMDEALRCCDYKSIQLLRPFVYKTKAEVVRIGAEVHAPFQLTWSCYEGRTYHCGKCGTCVERREAFELAHVDDPTNWE